MALNASSSARARKPNRGALAGAIVLNRSIRRTMLLTSFARVSRSSAVGVPRSSESRGESLRPYPASACSRARRIRRACSRRAAAKLVDAPLNLGGQVHPGGGHAGVLQHFERDAQTRLERSPEFRFGSGRPVPGRLSNAPSAAACSMACSTRRRMGRVSSLVIGPELQGHSARPLNVAPSEARSLRTRCAFSPPLSFLACGSE